ncbi:hypothetical protein N752_04150 [Desulforamulus aquiferis]|nr:MATE family efflux transporter [Desulforamulus aquiferis]RYD06526.1 hypothetical protein N752_04150 [Desulforamulus aquiferis]
MEDEIRLVKEPINKLILTLAMPAVLGHVADIGYNLIDGIFVGQWVGPQGLAGIGLTFPLTLINMAISLMIGVGTSTAIGRYIGSKDYASCNKVLSLGLVLTTLINLLLSLIVIGVGDKVLTIMGADSVLVGYAMQYIGVVALGFVFMGIAMLLCDALRNEGIIKPSIIVMVIVLAGNIILDVLFMYVLKLGMYGAALATLLSQMLAAFYIITYYLTKKLNFKISFSQLDYKLTNEIFSVGSGVFFRELVEAVTLIVLNSIILSMGGSIYLASFSIIDKIIMLVYMPIGGFAEAYNLSLPLIMELDK